MCSQSTDIVTTFPANTFDDTLAMPSLLTIASLHFFAKTSTANLLLISVAVVITGVAFISAANNTASSLAPPTCPERIGITNCPSSSITITGLSLSLLFTEEAIALTAIPHAPIKIRAFFSLICAAVQSDIFCDM